MGLLRTLGRAAPLVAAGLVARHYMRRQGLIGAPAKAELPWPEVKGPPAVEGSAVEVTVEETVEEPPPDAPTIEQLPVEEDEGPPDVTAVVDDLLSARPARETIADAEVVEDAPPGSDRALAESVRMALAEQPGLLQGTLEIEALDGTVWLRGELHEAEDVAEVERRVAAVPGVRRVRSLLSAAGGSQVG
jgi:BON domain